MPDQSREAREAWRDGVAAGGDPVALSCGLLRNTGALDADDALDWTCGLAAAQWETGRLQSDAQQRVLSLLAEAEQGGHPAPKVRALRRLSAKLASPMPAPNKLRRVTAGPDVGLEVGDAIRIWSTDHTRAALYLVNEMVPHRQTYWPNVIGLYYPSDATADVSSDVVELLPALHWLDLSSFDHQRGIPDYKISGRPFQQTIVIAGKSDHFSPRIGDVVARGVDLSERPGPTFLHDHPTNMASWNSLIGHLDRGTYGLFEEATRRFLDGGPFESFLRSERIREKRRSESEAALPELEARLIELYGESYGHPSE